MEKIGSCILHRNAQEMSLKAMCTSVILINGNLSSEFTQSGV